MKLVLTCLISLLHLLYAEEQVPNNLQHQDPVIRSVQEKYDKMKMAVMFDVDNEITVVNMNHVKRPDASHQTRAVNDIANDIGFYLYTRGNREDPVKYSLDNVKNVINNELFNLTKKTVFLVHGYLNNLTSPMIQMSMNALLTYHNVNVIAVDWYQVMAKQRNVYNWCAGDTLLVGEAVGLAISELIGGGLNADLTHLVGHSLGAHVVGVAGRYLNDRNQTIARITGLDPAKIEFTEVPIPSRINAGDAKFVDCIHTCGSYLAFDRPLCQTDFYPNGGLFQPGCSFLGDICCICSHGRSYRYFAESIKPNHTFPAQKCILTSSGLLGCTASSQMMGYPAKSEFKGTFFVKTESDYPFSPEVERPPEFGFWDQLKAWWSSIKFIIT